MKHLRHWIVLTAALAMAGCGRDEIPAAAPALLPGDHAYTVTGLIREFPVDGRSVVIRHDEISGYMPKMTMTFTLRDTNELRGLAVGDSVAFRLVATADDHWIDSLRRLAAGSPADRSSPPDANRRAAISGHQLHAGDPLPDFTFTGEDGAAARPADFRGQAVAFTFLFTRCPLPDFCPRMSKHFSRARNLLLTQNNAPTNWQFLSLSFDPEHDSPAVLAQYAKNYRGQSADRWRFGVIQTNVLEALAPSLDLKVAAEGGSFMHNLRTVVLDPRGRIHRQFDGNDWTPEQLAEALGEAARMPAP